jgi:CubicO group peptidase (beta-lactamase class C family)
VPNRTDTRFAVASITKQFTAAANLQLRDAGKLALTDSICRFVDPCPEAWKPVTLKGLLNHTAGVPDYEEPLELGSADYTAFIGRPDNIDIILKEAATKPLDFEPGSKWHYSNTGYILLSRVIAKVSGQTYERYVEDHVLTPAGMRFSSIDDGVVTPGSAQGYAAVRELPLETLLSGVSFENLPINERSPGALAGDHGDASLWTTAEDLARWVQALEGGRIVSAASLAEMKEPGQFGYGYGLEVAKVANDRLRIRHTGGDIGFDSVVLWYPNPGVTLVVLSNY